MMAAVSFSARTAEVVSKLMHDVESNPGPDCFEVKLFCKKYFYDISPNYQGDCPGAGILGFQSGVLHDADTSVDPLERLFPGSTYTFSGSQRFTTSIATAIQAFTDREYPDVGGKGLKIVPDLPRPQDGITWEDVSKHCVGEASRHGGLVQG